MKEKKIGFYTGVVQQIFDGKTRTYRLRDHKLKVGDKVVFENTQTSETFGHAVITDVKRVRVKDIDLKDALHYKTYKTRKELIKAFKFHYPDRNVTQETDVFVYTYDFTATKAQNKVVGKGKKELFNGFTEKKHTNLTTPRGSIPDL